MSDPMLQYDFEESIGYWIFSTAHELTRAMNDELAAHGITFRQWEVLAWLSFLGEMSQSELADNMRIEAPTLAGMLDRMERDGWILRIQDESDRRKKRIQPTERVEPVWSKMVDCALRVRGRAAAGISPQHLAIVRDTLAAMRENLAAADPLPAPDSAPAVPPRPLPESSLPESPLPESPEHRPR